MQCVQGRRVRLHPAIAGVEAEKTQNTQVVFGDARRRIADKPDPAGLQVRYAAEIVEHGAIARHRHGVDGEVAARGILLPVGGERDDSMAAIGFHIAAQCRDLEASTSTTAVTVPWASPVGTTFTPALPKAVITASGGLRRCQIDICHRPVARASRTAPPTTRASGSASQTFPKAGSFRNGACVMAARPDVRG